jgi:hypothetical protein
MRFVRGLAWLQKRLPKTSIAMPFVSLLGRAHTVRARTDWSTPETIERVTSPAFTAAIGSIARSAKPFCCRQAEALGPQSDSQNRGKIQEESTDMTLKQEGMEGSECLSSGVSECATRLKFPSKLA